MTFSNPVVGGENGELIRAAIHSPDYVPGVSGWIIRRDGSAEFNNVTIRIDSEVGGRITVGPEDGPQVVIRVSNDTGLIQFETNAGYEATPPSISATAPPDELQLTMHSGLTGGSASLSRIDLFSGDDDTALEPFTVIGSYSGTGYSELNLTSTHSYLDTPEFRVSGEIEASSDNDDNNFPVRVVGGRVTAGSNTLTLTAADQEVTNTSSTPYLVNGAAYMVDVQLRTRQSVGSSAAGTQAFDWKLWDGAVGGTQLDASMTTWNTTVGNVLGLIQFSFLFNYTGVTGNKTLRLSCADIAGADTLQVVTDTRFFLIVRRMGDPAKITGL